MNNKYGLKFRNLRKRQHITLVEAANGITSKSSLQRWEQGKDNLSFNQVLLLLKRIHIQPMEFLETITSSQLYRIANKINIAYVKSDKQALHKYALENIAKYRSNPQDINSFFESCIACNFYNDLFNENLLNYKEINQLTSNLINIDEWNYEYLFYFGNTLGLLDSSSIYRLSISLINYSNNEKIFNRKWYDDVLNTLLNAITSLIRKDYKKAQLLLNKFNKLQISDRHAYEKIHAKMFQAYINYIETKK